MIFATATGQLGTEQRTVPIADPDRMVSQERDDYAVGGFELLDRSPMLATSTRRIPWRS